MFHVINRLGPEKKALNRNKNGLDDINPTKSTNTMHPTSCRVEVVNRQYYKQPSRKEIVGVCMVWWMDEREK